MKGYNHLRKKALSILKDQLSESLTYHGIHHTLNVLNVCNQYIRRNKIPSHPAKLLRLGALLHDIGFTVSNINHEEHSVKISRELMRECNFNSLDTETVVNLIYATRIPQHPKNELEKILCDADLDYLGRSDFYSISDQLFQELKYFSVLKDKKEWNKAQIKFLESHSYHTPYAQKYRQQEKEKRIKEIRSKLN